jgi:large subunit ribosomal protein L24e
MTSCTFCGGPIEAGTGKMYIRRDATVFHFCSSKCQRNQVDLGRVNRHVRWTQAAEEHKSERVEVHAATQKAAAAKAAAKAKAKPAKEPAKAATAPAPPKA